MTDSGEYLPIKRMAAHLLYPTVPLSEFFDLPAHLLAMQRELAIQLSTIFTSPSTVAPDRAIIQPILTRICNACSDDDWPVGTAHLQTADRVVGGADALARGAYYTAHARYSWAGNYLYRNASTTLTAASPTVPLASLLEYARELENDDAQHGRPAPVMYVLLWHHLVSLLAHEDSDQIAAPSVQDSALTPRSARVAVKLLYALHDGLTFNAAVRAVGITRHYAAALLHKLRATNV